MTTVLFAQFLLLSSLLLSPIVLATNSWPWVPQTPWHKGSGDGIPSEAYEDLVRFTRYASAVYTPVCPRPLGNTLVAEFTSVITGVHGLVARDDEKQEIVIAFRGSQQIEDMFTDANMLLVPYGENKTIRVHAGFAFAFTSIEDVVLEIIDEQTKQYENYEVIATGHSMGGSLAALASVALKANMMNLALRMFTFGQPRTGNAEFADLVEEVVGSDNTFRAVHTWDGVPTIIPTAFGYHHHKTEYWQFQEPPSRKNVRQCQYQEDSNCSRSIPSTGINAAHDIYFGQVMAVDASLCI